ncbi:MAG TPA: M48 family metallopeptidase, partial [Armatimonadota bacterium]
DNMARRALRWLYRTFRLVALTGAFLVGVLLVAMPAPAFAEKSPQHVEQTDQISGGAPTPQERELANRHATQGRLIFLGSFLYQGALLFGFLLLGGTRWLARLVARFGGRWVFALGAVLGILAVAGTVLSLPLDYYAGFIFPHQYGLSNQTFPQWLRDYLLNDGVSLVISLPVLVLFYAVLRWAPRTWWLWMGVASAPLSIFLVLIQPVFIAPLFNKFTSLRDVELRQEILALAQSQGIEAHDVYEVDASRQSKAVNAYVNGFGPTQRIVLYDTLLTYFTHDEIKFVMAHEMGHYVLGHIRQGIIVSIIGTLVGGFAVYWMAGWLLGRYAGFFGFSTLAHPASYPLLMALGMALSLVAFPLGNAYSRHLEAQADRFAVEIYPYPDAGISAFHKMARLNISQENPPAWVELLLASHPSIQQRIAMLEAAKRQERGL